MKVLFICNQNKHRSKTAEEVFRDRFETRSAGLYNDEPVSEKDLSWADVIFVMEETQRSEIAKRFPQTYLKKRILNMDVPDIYGYGQKELVEVLESKLKDLF